ncbi:MAG: hypothetical protein ACJ72N_15855 [Labedaea sp.]
MTDSDNTRANDGLVAVDRAHQENLSWQRSGLGPSGRYTGRDYYDDRRASASVDLPARPVADPQATGRAVKVIGLVVAMAGVAGWLWMILAFVSKVGAGTMPDDPFGTRWAGMPLGSSGLVAMAVGGVIAAFGSWLARTARVRRSRVR